MADNGSLRRRRIIRLIDRVFDKEINLQRVKEFRTLTDDRLTSKRGIVTENLRQQRLEGDDTQSALTSLEGADTQKLVDVHCFIAHSEASTEVIINTLAERCPPSFTVLRQVLPEGPA